ncbi:hypothetical protein [Phreatobacter cathodiphilus]|uniref:Uncharacterized protein n=1 Tax=Phreatobacter cathodiphilus TaxID=1868589 RepID=A0A2S0N8B6_9HYPH|nr:hypothetical protein [Phreatobacter cathodiphilus]AVO44257.1 hypothetical protein C6569_03785 [Phreatobacter cathodiphilus]
MPADVKADALQKEGTREFEEAIAGKGPKMPASSTTKAEEAELNKALEDTFPASDPVQPSAPDSSLGAPAGRKSVDANKDA